MSTQERRLTKEDALAIHGASLARFGGLPGLRDEGLLESALAQPFQAFGGEELYPTFAEKAARYAYGIAKNHPFLDGNKPPVPTLGDHCCAMASHHACQARRVPSVTDGTRHWEGRGVLSSMP